MSRPRNTRRAPKTEPLPETVLQAFAWLHARGLALGHAAMSGRVRKKRNAIVRGALRLASEVRDSALGIEAAGLASWTLVRDLTDPPESPASALWLVAQCCKIVARVDDGTATDDTDDATTLEALRMFGGAVKVEPIESRVEAQRMLQEGRSIEKQRSGPRPVKAPRKAGGVLRVVR